MSARTILRSNGRAYRVLLNQPPHFRKGRDAAPAVDAVERDAVRAIAASQFELRDKSAALASR